LATHLRFYGCDGAISQLLRFGSATFLEGSGTKGSGSDAEGASIPSRPAPCSGSVYWADNFGGKEISGWVRTDCLVASAISLGSSNPSLHQE
jgi:hypothetical protein